MKSTVFRLLYGSGLVFDLARWVIVAAIILVFVNTFWATVFIVDGLSMEPTLHDKELVLLRKNSSFEKRPPQHGDVVVVRYPGDPAHRRYVKRIVALPGEKIEVRNGQVFVNDRLDDELYLSVDVKTEPDGLWQLAGQEYFLMGDNRPNSNDSRYFGPVEKRFLIGRALAIVFPRTLFLR